MQLEANSFQTRRNFHIQKQHSHAQLLKLVITQRRFTPTEQLVFSPATIHNHGNNKVRTLIITPYTIALHSSHPLHHQTPLPTKPMALTSHQHSKKPDAPTNPRGIPFAPFVDNVSDYCTTRAEVEPTLKSFSEMIQKYQFMEVNTSRRAAGLREKIPDISKTLDTVRFLKSRGEDAEELESYFELNDTLFAKAKVPKTEEVYLWLGANVMLAYPMEEAEELLEGKLQAAKSGLENAEEDMDFLREQITVSVLLWLGLRMLDENRN